jgi:hypothetical protein
MMDTKNFIENLSKDVKSVRPLPTRKYRWLEFMSGSLIATGITFLLFSIRHDLNEVIWTPKFFVGSFILFVGWMFASYSLSVLQDPTSSTKKYIQISSFLIASLGTGYLVHSALMGGFVEGARITGSLCSFEIIFLSLLQSIVILFLLRRGAPTQIGLLGINVGLACGFLGASALQYSCPIENSSHLMIWHLILPFAVLTTAGYFFARKFLRW